MDSGIYCFAPARSGTYIIKIYSYIEKCFFGSLYCPGTGCTYQFKSLAQMLLLLQRQMDEMDFPQRWVESGVSWTAQESEKPIADSPDTGCTRLAVFKLNVLFRQNASWQGNIVWSEKNASSNFRSVLELIELMDSALTAAACE